MKKGTSNNDIPKQSNNGNTDDKTIVETFCIQTYALMHKNFILQRRNIGASLTVYFSGFLFLFAIWLCSFPINNMSKSGFTEAFDQPHPKEYDIFTIPCSVNSNLENPICYNFVVIGNTTHDRKIAKYLEELMDSEGENEIHGWRQFESKDSFQTWTSTIGKNVTRLGVEMLWPIGMPDVTTPSMFNPTMDEITYTIHYNVTGNSITSWSGAESTNLNKLAAMQMHVDSAILRYMSFLKGEKPSLKTTAKITGKVKASPHPEDNFFNFDIFNWNGPNTLLICVTFNFVVQAYQMAMEKEHKLPEMLAQMGMMKASYYASWFLTHVITNLVQSLLLILFGNIFAFDFFVKTDFSVLFFMFFLSTTSFTALAFLVVAFVRSGMTASNICLVIFITVYNAGGIVSGFVFTSKNESDTFWRYFFTWLPIGNPAMTLYVPMQQNIQATEDGESGFKWPDRLRDITPPGLNEDGTPSNAFWSVETTMIHAGLFIFVSMWLSIYIEMVLPNAYGKGRSFLFCLRCLFRRSNNGEIVDVNGMREKIVVESDDPDVQAEAQRVKNGEKNGRNIAIEVVGLVKTFHGGDLRAVDGISYGIDNNSLFVLLGHNGAGKTTTINMLVGNMDISGGDAFIRGLSASSDMDTINRQMGVCPQHDVLWDELTGYEHLYLFSTMRGMSGKERDDEVALRLKEVNLTGAANISSGAYSGGMKRRLSIACALVGNPKVLYLDEPTTGMDPVTRREVWDMIQKARIGRVVLLTTHSMEEADVLGDRIAIMSHGKIQAYGTSLSLKHKYGQGLKMTMLLNDEVNAPDAINFVKSKISKSELLKQVEKAVFFRLPSETEEGEDSIVDFFKTLEAEKSKIGVKDFSIGLSTLEEVFLELSKKDSFINDEDEEPPQTPGRFERFLSSLGEKIPAIFGPKERTYHSTLLAPLGLINVILNLFLWAKKRPYPTSENGVVLTSKRRLLCAPRFHYSAKVVPPKLNGIVSQNEWRHLLGQVNNPMLKNSMNPFYWLLFIFVSWSIVGDIMMLDDGQMQAAYGTDKMGALQLFFQCCLFMGIITVYYAFKRSRAMAALHLNVRCSPKVRISVRSHSLLSASANSILSDIVSDRRWCIIIEPAGGEPVATAPEVTLFGKIFSCGGLEVVPVAEKKNKRKTSFNSARKALVSKTVAILKRNWLAILFSLIFPMAIFGLLNWLDTGLLWRYRWESMCGEFIYDAKECRKRGYNLTCVKPMRTFTMPNRQAIMFPKYHGRDCGQLDPSKNRTYACNFDTQRPYYRLNMSNLGSTIVGNRKIKNYEKNGEGLATWFQNLQLLLTDPNYDCVIPEYQSCGDYCETRRSDPDCFDECIALQQARDWYGVQNTSRSVGEMPWSTCAKNKDDDGNDKGEWRPLERYIKKVKELDTAQDICMMRGIRNLARWFNTTQADFNSESNFNLIAAIDNVEVTKEGILGKFTTESLRTYELDWGRGHRGFETFWHYIGNSWFKKIGPPLNNTLSTLGLSEVMFQYGMVSSKKFCTTFYQLKALHEAEYDRALRMFLESGSKQLMSTDQFCKAATNLDVIRGLEIDPVENNNVLDDIIYGIYDNNEVVQTKLMKKREDDMKAIGFRSRALKYEHLSYGFKKADEANGVYDYTVYVNYTGTPGVQMAFWGTDVTDLVPRVNVMNAAIFDTFGFKNAMNQPFKLAQPYVEQFKPEWKCNREELIDAKLNGLPYPPLDCPSLLFGFLALPFLDLVMAVMLMFILPMPFIATMSSIVNDKESKTGIIMKMMGLRPSVYWFVTYIIEVSKTMSYMIFIFLAGTFYQFKLFVFHDPFQMLLMMFIFSNVLVIFAFFFSTFFKTSNATLAGSFLIVIMSFNIGFLFIHFVYGPGGGRTELFEPFMIHPFWVMYRYLEGAAFLLFFNDGQGVKLSLDTDSLYLDGLLSTCLSWLLLHWFIWFFLWLYALQVFNVGDGTREHPLFFLNPKYWQRVCGMSDVKHKGTYTQDDLNVVPDRVNADSKEENGKNWTRPHDVEQEHNRVVEAMVSNDPKIRIAVSGLHKVFGSKNGKGGKVAVKSVSFGVNENECMGVLGHNGAGKTTTINMLTGLFSPSGGTANINGYNIKTDFSAIYAEMAVCPQHDILWPTLTAKEHLEFYGQLKGYFRGALRQRVLKALNQVNLMAFANRYSGGFSGGMKRRLSMANALVGDPSVVFMDEPSTGLDPASKHQLWEVISNAKGQNKSMILTTHSMEEADVLCDRIAIMAAGEMQCIGAGYQLKRRFGKGYTFQISSSKNMKAIDDYVHTLFPSARILEDPIGGLAKYEVSREDVVISTVFHELTENKEKCKELGITSWGLTETTLEEVFLKLAALAEIFDETETTKLVTKDKSKNLAEQLMSLDSEAIDVSKGLLNDSNNYQLPPRINNDNDDGKNGDKKYEIEATEKAQGD